MRARRTLSGLLSALLGAGLVPLVVSPAQAAGSVGLTSLGSAYTQDFNTLALTGTSSITPDGWYFNETGTNANTTYNSGTGSSNTGDTYSFGASGSTERAFGGLQSGSLVPTIGASFTNNTGSTITTLDIAYTGEQWRLGTTARVPERLDFQYSLDATSLTTGVWTDVDTLDFASPTTGPTVGLLDGNAAANRTAVSATVGNQAIPSGGTFWIRWVDFNATSSDDGLAVDDFSLTPSLQDTAPSVSATSPQAGETGVSTVSDISIIFSEPVTVSDPWFSITCTSTGSHSAAAAGGPTTFTLDPSTDFAVGESCTVTISASQVVDQDATDPPDTMAGDAVFSFTITNAVCGASAVFIHEVQGSGTASAYANTVVTVEGVVVGDYQGTGQLGGYYLQEEDAQVDTEENTSEGIFVFSSTAVNLGDVVRVTGRVQEFFDLTEIDQVSSTTVCSTGNSVTTTQLALPVEEIADFEHYEGMQVIITQPLTVTEVFTLGRFGEVALSATGRLDVPTNEFAPLSTEAVALQSLNDRSRILLDDGNSQQNLNPTFYPQGGLSATNTLRVGDSVGEVFGVFDYRFGVYRVQPRDPATIAFTHTNPRPVGPEPVGGNAKVAAFNVLNYFNGNGDGTGFPTARGASTVAELDRQRAKIVSAITALDADVIGLMELENDDPSTSYSAIEDLVDGLNAQAGPGTYDFVDTGIVGTDAIRVGILYQPATVTPAGSYEVMTSAVDPRFIDTLNRPSIAQTFQFNASGDRFTVVVNHLKSKGSDCNSVGDPDVGDGQGNCNLTRTNAAEALVDWLATDPTCSGDTDVLLIGDMNAYAKEDPITAFRNGGYVDTTDSFIGDDGYSYVFQGQSGYLDHALASPSLVSQVSDVTEWHINADEPVALDYNTEFNAASYYAPDQYRSSDHDPVLVGLNLDNAAPTVDAGGSYSVVEGSSVSVSATGSDPESGALAYAWDLDNNGTFETSGQTVTFSAAGIEAPATRTIQVQVTDSEGATSVDSATVTVIWNFVGFFGPIQNLPEINDVRPGTVIKVRFGLDGNQGLDIFATGSPTSVPIDCTTRAPIGSPEPTISNPAGLTYSATAGVYQYEWKTRKRWTGCRRLTVTLADGTVHEADFRFV